MKSVKIPVFMNPDNADALEAIHGRVPLSECNIRNVTFYKKFSALEEDIEKCGTFATTIMMDCGSFATPLKIRALEELFSIFDNED